MNKDSLCVFVCYEGNNHALAVECGAINQLTIFGNESKAIEWFYSRLSAAKEDGFVLDVEEGDLSKAAIQDALGSKFFSVTMFSGYQENWDESFDIVIEIREVQFG